jgi:hypothetical protein
VVFAWFISMVTSFLAIGTWLFWYKLKDLQEQNSAIFNRGVNEVVSIKFKHINYVFLGISSIHAGTTTIY